MLKILPFSRYFCLATVLLWWPSFAWASGTVADLREEFARTMAKELYCQATIVLGGDVTVFLGFAITAAAFMLIIFKGLSKGYMIMALSGLLLSAIPALWEAGFDGLVGVSANLLENGRQEKLLSRNKFAGTTGSCDFGSSELRDALDSAVDSQTPTNYTNNTDYTTTNNNYSPSSCNGTDGSSVVSSGTVRCTSGFGMRTHPIYKNKRLHGGIDFAAPEGTPVTSALNGTISRVGFDPGGYGNYVVIDYGNGVYGRYSHLQSATNLKKGDSVRRGQQVGRVGSTGGSTGPHLDYSETTDGYKKYVNPCGSKGTGAVC